jgi:small subunit ribosomal protein S16
VAVKIRLKRMGAKKSPTYRIVVSDSRDKRDGRSIEELGYYDPKTNPVTVVVKNERALVWLKQGAKPTPTAKALLSKAGVIEQFQLARKGE